MCSSDLFFKQRGLALGIMLSGTGLCAMTVPQFTVWMISEFGWRAAYVGLAALPLFFAGPIVFLFFKPGETSPSDPEEATAIATGYSLGEALTGYRFWILLISIFLIYIAMSGIVPNLIPALTDLGISAQKAATAIGVFGITVIAGRLVVGYLVDSSEERRVGKEGRSRWSPDH